MMFKQIKWYTLCLISSQILSLGAQPSNMRKLGHMETPMRRGTGLLALRHD